MDVRLGPVLATGRAFLTSVLARMQLVSFNPCAHATPSVDHNGSRQKSRFLLARSHASFYGSCMHARRDKTQPPTTRGSKVQFRAERAAEIALTHADAVHIFEQAKFYGVHPSTYSRVIGGVTKPGEEFIAAVLSSHPELDEVSWDDLFEVVELAS